MHGNVDVIANKLIHIPTDSQPEVFFQGRPGDTYNFDYKATTTDKQQKHAASAAAATTSKT
eukprot:scaffold121449_cov27-Prasinocladus_malaysianus.AAC.2